MSFEGVIESLSRNNITGWASYIVNGKPQFPQLRLQFHKHEAIFPTETVDRGERTGFVFRLPEAFREMRWRDFLDDFDAVVASFPADMGAGQWRVPFFKSVLAPLDPDNRTALLAARLKEYKIAPEPNGKIAAFTIAYNEPLMIPLWSKYYAKQLGAENLFVLDQGSDKTYGVGLPKGVNIIRFPREEFDNWLIARIVAIFQRLLLESYDTVIYSDSDEFICSDPQALKGKSLAEHLRSLPVPVGITTGYNLVHDIATEGAYDPTRPLLSQRRFVHRMTTMDKPLISRVPLNWVPGFHNAAEGGITVPGLYMLHLRWFDLDQALVKGGHYRSSAWSAFDVEHQLASYQREGEQEIISRFRALSASVSGLREAEFDPAASFSVVPNWMRAAIAI
jgi:hypothetical protein